ncbi:hypothetical protein Hanom_Chr14g01269351 [Helianthus anomalus]
MGVVSYNNLVQDYDIRAEWNLVLPSKTDMAFPLKEGHIPELIVFRAFFILVWKSPFFTFDRRDTDVSCLRDIPTSSKDKDWKKKFVYIDADVIPGEMHWGIWGRKTRLKMIVLQKTLT